MHTSSKHIMFSAPCKKWKREEQRFVSNKNTKRHKEGKKEKTTFLKFKRKNIQIINKKQNGASKKKRKP